MGRFADLIDEARRARDFEQAALDCLARVGDLPVDDLARPQYLAAAQTFAVLSLPSVSLSFQLEEITSSLSELSDALGRLSAELRKTPEAR